MIEPSEGVMVARWAMELWRWIRQGQGSQPQLTTHIEKSSLSFLGIKRERYSHKKFSESGVQIKTKDKKEPLLKDKEISTGGKKDVASLKKAAEKGDANAQFSLGLMYDKFGKDYEQAFHWYCKAAEQSHHFTI